MEYNYGDGVYWVIEGGYWRHGYLHVQSDNLTFASKATDKELYKQMAEWIIQQRQDGIFNKTFDFDVWPEFFAVLSRPDGIIEVAVNEEGIIWFVPETHVNFQDKSPAEGSTESWLHGSEEMNAKIDYAKDMIFFDELFPEGHEVIDEGVEM